MCQDLATLTALQGHHDFQPKFPSQPLQRFRAITSLPGDVLRSMRERSSGQAISCAKTPRHAYTHQSTQPYPSNVRQPNPTRPSQPDHSPSIPSSYPRAMDARDPNGVMASGMFSSLQGTTAQHFCSSRECAAGRWTHCSFFWGMWARAGRLAHCVNHQREAKLRESNLHLGVRKTERTRNQRAQVHGHCCMQRR